MTGAGLQGLRPQTAYGWFREGKLPVPVLLVAPDAALAPAPGRTRGDRVSGLRKISAPFVAAAPAGARVRTRVRASSQDANVLAAVGAHLGALASADLAARVREGRLDGTGRVASRRERKRGLTAGSSSRWAGAITRTTDDLWALAERNVLSERASLRARTRQIEARLRVPVGGRHGRTRGYATQEERWQKQQRLQRLRARATASDRQLDRGHVAVCRGGGRLARARHNLDPAKLTQTQWRARWEAERWFITADGEAGKAWGNETIRWHPVEGWTEIKLPAPLAHLANRPHARYRLSCQVSFPYRGDEVAAQAASGAVRYDISYDPARGRWYMDASWRTDPGEPPAIDWLREMPVLAVDLNHDHLAAWVVLPDGNPAGVPVTIPLMMTGLPASHRDGLLRDAISTLNRIAKYHGCRAMAIEDLDFADARAQGREKQGRRPSRGKRGRSFRRLTGSIPTARFRDRLTQMAYNQGLRVIAVDPAYTSQWGRQHWLAPLRDQVSPVTTGHHAAAVVIGRRAHGHRARRQAGVTGADQRISRRRATPRAPSGRRADSKGGPRKAQRQPHSRHQTAPAERPRPPDQATQHRPGPPADPVPTTAQ